MVIACLRALDLTHQYLAHFVKSLLRSVLKMFNVLGLKAFDVKVNICSKGGQPTPAEYNFGWVI